MGLESATYINDLVDTNPLGSDPKSVGDDHIRLEKSTAKNTFPGFTGAVLVGGVFSGSHAPVFPMSQKPIPFEIPKGDEALDPAGAGGLRQGALQVGAAARLCSARRSIEGVA